jgi:hypothetical protein
METAMTAAEAYAARIEAAMRATEARIADEHYGLAQARALLRTARRLCLPGAERWLVTALREHFDNPTAQTLNSVRKALHAIEGEDDGS